MTQGVPSGSRLSIAALALLSSLTFTGCSSAGPGSAAPERSSASPVAPTVPPGAASAARGYYEAIRLGFVTGDTAPLTRLATPDCAACQSVVTGITDERTARTAYRGGEITAFETVNSTDTTDGVALVVRYSTRPFEVTTDGASPESAPGANAARTRVTLQRSDSGWLVRELEPLTAP